MKFLNSTHRDEIARKVRDHVLHEFMAASDQGRIIRNINYRTWAADVNFEALNRWVIRFKKRYNIVRRKVTRIVSKSQRVPEEQAKNVAQDFVSLHRPLLNQYGAKNTFNADESGFKYEMFSMQTQAFKGAKVVKGQVQSSSATTHNYTIFPFIRADDQLMSPLFIVLQEKGGEFGPNAKRTLGETSNHNVYVGCTTSGKQRC